MDEKKNNKKQTKKQDKKQTKKTKTKVEKVKKNEIENTEKPVKKKKKKKALKIILRIILVLFILVIIAAAIGAAAVIGILSSDKYKVSRDKLIIKNFNTRVLDTDGNVIATINGDENRKWVDMENMPEYLPKLFIALEDERFYSHKGVDLKRTIGATVGFLFGKGSSSYGGSTITQQLIKNTFQDKDDSGMAGIQRKIREIARAYNVEKVLSKNEILELYLNKIFMGGTYYGVGTAAEYYFNKNIKDLSLAECSYLVAINTSPNAYKPFSAEQADKDKIKNKVKVVLSKFKSVAPEIGYELTDEVYNAAVAEVDNGLNFQQGKVITNATLYSYHTEAAIKQAVEQLMEEQNLTKEAAELAIKNNGYTIYSTQVNDIQAIMQEEFLQEKYLDYGRDTKEDGSLLNEGHSQAAMVIIEPTTGQVVACMGGLGEDSNATGINRATSLHKQPGSSIKPIGVVAPALEAGTITAATVFDDSYTVFEGGYDPHNSDYGYLGPMTVRHAIEHSSNIVNIKILLDLGAEKGAEFLKNIGFDLIRKEDVGAPFALGVTTTTPLQMAAAYAMIANNGVYIEPTFYTKVEDSDGNVVFEAKQETKRAMSEQNAYVLKEILTEPVTGNGGTATTCWIRGMEVGAKTGSTDRYKDRWLCGITPYYAAACWFGFDYAEVTRGISGNGAARIWGEVMREVHEPLEGKRFDKPEGVVTAAICLDSGCVATAECENIETEYFAAGTVPKPCQGHTKVKLCRATGKLANDFCPEVDEVLYTLKPEKENTNLWKTYNEDSYEPPTERCDIHKEPEKVEMPDVVGKTAQAAKKALEDRGLNVEIVYTEDKKKEDGIVLKQNKAEKSKVEKGSTVTITVNKKEKEKENTVSENTIHENTVHENTVHENTVHENTTSENTTN